MKEKVLKYRNIIDVLIIVVVTFFLCIPLLSSKLDVYTDDGIQHIARAYGTYTSIKQNGLFTNIISSFSNGFGYSWDFFYGPVSTFGIIIINLIFNNFIVSYKILCFIVLLLSGIFMYKYIQNLTSNNNIGLLAGILYLSFPYHLTDLYIRNALGEFMSFMFIPLVFLGLYNLFYSSSKHYYFAIGMIGLILTHNLSTLIVTFFVALYIGLNTKKFGFSNVKKLFIIDLIFIVLITAFYVLPFIEIKFFTKYQVYEKGMMATIESFADNGLKLNQLFVTKNDGSFVYELGPHIIIMLGLSIMAIRLMKEEIKETYVFCLLSGIICLWMSTRYFPWKLFPEEVSFIQFPWRFLMPAGFFLSVVCSLNILIILKKFTFSDLIVISSIAILYTLAFTGHLSYVENLANISDIELGKVSGRDHEVIAGMGKGEYLPSRAYDNRFYIATRDEYIDILEDGDAIIQNEVKDGTHYEADIVASENNDFTVLELPYIYYPGYEVRQDGMISKTFQTENGFLGTAMAKNDNAKLEVNYVGTKIMNVSKIISSISLIVFGIYIWKKR